MRIKCPHCREKFCIAHRAILAEAERLQRRSRLLHISVQTDGNSLDPGDVEAKRIRDEAVERRRRSLESAPLVDVGNGGLTITADRDGHLLERRDG